MRSLRCGLGSAVGAEDWAVCAGLALVAGWDVGCGEEVVAAGAPMFALAFAFAFGCGGLTGGNA